MRVASGGIGAGLFLSAFSPVLVAVALVTVPFDALWANAVLIVTCAAPAAFIGVTLRSARKLQENLLRYERVRRTDRDVLTFMASFVLPVATAFFATGDERRPATVAATIVLLALLLVIYLRAGLYQLNPLLSVLGFRLFEVEQASGTSVTVLSRRHSLPAGSVLATRFSDDVYIDLGPVDSRRIDSRRTDVVRTDPARTDPAHPDPARTDSASTDPQRRDPTGPRDPERSSG